MKKKSKKINKKLDSVVNVDQIDCKLTVIRGKEPI
jgi:hypothetical protein